MRARIAIAQPTEVEMTLTLTMPMRKWVELRAQLSRDYPSWQLSSAIGDLIDKAKESVCAEIETGP